MDGQAFTITFIYQIIADSLSICLTAEILKISPNKYSVTNVRQSDSYSGSLIPAFILLNIQECWVHEHGKKETTLSVSIGNSISQFLEQNKSSF